MGTLIARVEALLFEFQGLSLERDLEDVEANNILAIRDRLYELTKARGWSDEFFDNVWGQISTDPDFVLAVRANDIDEVTSIITDYYSSFGWDELDTSQLLADLPILYSLARWDPVIEQGLMNLLGEKLEELDAIHIGDQVVPVPFKEKFEVFLRNMEARQAALQMLWDEYFGEDDNPLGEFFKWLFEHSNKIFSEENLGEAFRALPRCKFY